MAPESATRARTTGGRPGPAARPGVLRRIPWIRVAGASGMVMLTGILFWLVTDEGFRVTPERVEVRGVRYADMAIVSEHLGRLDLRPNVFRVRAGDVADDLASLPEVVGAEVSTALPGNVRVDVVERQPILVWRSGDEAWLVDVEGVLFAPADAATAAELGSGATGTALPAVEDDRILPEVLTLGDRLNVEDLAVLRQLLALRPGDVGSEAQELFLRIDGRLGYVLEVRGGWWAVFGHYTPNARKPDLVVGQVQCLRALLSRREGEVSRVNLAAGPGSCGTFRPTGSRASRGGRDAVP